MSLFQCGFRRTSRSDNSDSETEQQSTVIPSHVPSVEENGLGRLEYDEVVANRVPDLADPSHHPKEGGFLEVKIQYTQHKAVQK